MVVEAVEAVASINRPMYLSRKILTTKSISEPEVAEQRDIWAVLGIAAPPGIRQLLVVPVVLVGELNSDQLLHQVAVVVVVSKLMV